MRKNYLRGEPGDFDALLNEIFGMTEPRSTEKASRDTMPTMIDTKTGNIHSILSNKEKGVFTVVWEDGTSTMVSIQEGDTWDEEKALAMCYVKRFCGNKGAFNDIFTEVMPRVKVDRQKKTKKPKKETTFADYLAECESAPTTKTPNTFKLYGYQLLTDMKTFLMEDTMEEILKFVDRTAVRVGQPKGLFRFWEEDGGVYIDYGSHSRYFFIEHATAIDVQNMMKTE